MDRVRNPYNPGAGTRPPALVGRETEIEAMDVTLQRLLRGTNSQSQLLTGLRGTGKTVLLNEFEDLAEGRGYFHEYIEVSEEGALAAAIAAALRRVLLAMDAKRRIGDGVRRALGVLKAFTLRIPGGFELSIDVEAVAGPADSGDLGADLAGLFVEVGEIARANSTGILLAIDELHYVDQRTLTALLVGLHRATQERLPITISGAGLPTLAALTGEAKTYAERMFVVAHMGMLNAREAAEALQTPAQSEGVSWDEDAIHRALQLTKGYPYFLQEFGKHAWDIADGTDAITLDDVVRSIPVAMAKLDDSFFLVRAAGSTPAERTYMRAMAAIGPGPVKTTAVAAFLGKSLGSLSPVRDHLIKRAMCYVPHRGEIAFTVPLFDEFMKRWIHWEE